MMSAQVPAKIVLKSTTKMSLNDRFTNIALTRPPPTVTMIRTGLLEEHQAMVANQRFQQQMVNRPGLQALAAANRGKKPLQQRLGRPNVKARLNLAMVNQGRGGQQMMVRGRGSRRPSRGIRGGMVQRGGTNTFMPRGGQGRGRGQGQMMKMSGPMNQSRGNFNNSGQMQSGGRMRGRGRGFRGSRGGFVARGQEGEGRRSFSRRRGGAGMGSDSESWRGGGREWNYRGSRGGARGGGRGFRGGGGRPGPRGRGGRGQGRGRGAGGNVSREDLDTQLDEYMAKTRTQLDAELDTYMQQSS